MSLKRLGTNVGYASKQPFLTAIPECLLPSFKRQITPGCDGSGGGAMMPEHLHSCSSGERWLDSPGGCWSKSQSHSGGCDGEQMEARTRAAVAAGQATCPSTGKGENGSETLLSHFPWAISFSLILRVAEWWRYSFCNCFKADLGHLTPPTRGGVLAPPQKPLVKALHHHHQLKLEFL